jgi:predicted transcriptional regulator
MGDLYFPPRELAILSVLWRLGSATVAEVHTELGEKDLAYNSVLSALQTLEAKGYVGHKSGGRAYRYHALVKADRAAESALARIKAAIFQGSTERMFAKMISERGLSREELQRMRRLLAERLREDD